MENWLELIQDYISSRLTQAKWCEAKGFRVNNLRYQINKLNKQKQEKFHETQWVSVTLGPTDFRKSIDGLAVIVQIATRYRRI